MIPPPPNDQPLKVVVGQQLEGSIDTPSMRGAVARAACALLTPEQMAEVVDNRAIVEQAKGMLMMIYDIDAEQAYDLLIARSQTINVKLHTLARHLTEEFPTRLADERMLRQAPYDEVLLTASHEITEST